MVQARDNDNISKSIKRKDAKQGKLHKPPIANPLEKKLATECSLTKKQQTNSLLTTQIYLHTTQIDTICGMITISGIHLVSQHDRQYEKDRSHQSIKLQSTIVVYITVTI